MTVSSDNSGNRLGDICFVCDVCGHGLGGEASSADLLCGGCDTCRLSVEQHNYCAGLAKGHGGFVSDSA
jgi:hypothetical protein